MPTLSTRTLAALSSERGEEFDPALRLPSAPLAEDLAPLAGAGSRQCEPSPAERRRRRERARRTGCAPEARRGLFDRAASLLAAQGIAVRPVKRCHEQSV